MLVLPTILIKCAARLFERVSKNEMSNLQFESGTLVQANRLQANLCKAWDKLAVTMPDWPGVQYHLKCRDYRSLPGYCIPGNSDDPELTATHFEPLKLSGRKDPR
jgi:hypothetical protein